MLFKLYGVPYEGALKVSTRQWEKLPMEHTLSICF